MCGRHGTIPRAPAKSVLLVLLLAGAIEVVWGGASVEAFWEKLLGDFVHNPAHNKQAVAGMSISVSEAHALETLSTQSPGLTSDVLLSVKSDAVNDHRSDYVRMLLQPWHRCFRRACTRRGTVRDLGAGSTSSCLHRHFAALLIKS